jgi:hypothetical protein
MQITLSGFTMSILRVFWAVVVMTLFLPSLVVWVEAAHGLGLLHQLFPLHHSWRLSRIYRLFQLQKSRFLHHRLAVLHLNVLHMAYIILPSAREHDWHGGIMSRADNGTREAENSYTT